MPPKGVPELVHQPRDDALQAAHRTVHPQHDQHEEEDDRPELGAWECGHGLGVNLKHKARALDNMGILSCLDFKYSPDLICHVLYLLVLRLGHVAEVGEDDEAGEEAGEGVDGGGDQTVAIAVVVKLVVARVGKMNPKSSADT